MKERISLAGLYSDGHEEPTLFSMSDLTRKQVVGYSEIPSYGPAADAFPLSNNVSGQNIYEGIALVLPLPFQSQARCSQNS